MDPRASPSIWGQDHLRFFFHNERYIPQILGEARGSIGKPPLWIKWVLEIRSRPRQSPIEDMSNDGSIGLWRGLDLISSTHLIQSGGFPMDPRASPSIVPKYLGKLAGPLESLHSGSNGYLKSGLDLAKVLWGQDHLRFFFHNERYIYGG
jgi:hypothetical protein